MPKLKTILRALVIGASTTVAYAQTPGDFVDLRTVASDVVIDVRYATSQNFIGRPIPGYEAPKCLLTRAAAGALKRVQDTLRADGLSLKVYDCYRPQAAVDYFVAWAADPEDQSEKPAYYPSVDKADLIRNGYIAEMSGHSRGSTVDLTLVMASSSRRPSARRAGGRSCERGAADTVDERALDMGTAYDCFSVLSHTESPGIEPQQHANRLLLKRLMESNGFENLPEEWWHFTLSNEPYPDTYFSFPVR